jgi:hypothetical protein
MRLIKSLALCIATVAAALSVPTMAAASDDLIEPDTGTVGTEHIVVGNVGAQIFQLATNAFISCNMVTGEGMIDAFSVVEGTDTEVGALESLDFLQNGAQKCAATGLPVSSCNTTFNGLPLDIVVAEATNELIMDNIELIWACEAFIGTINCHYTASRLDGTLTPPANEVAVFGAAAGDDLLTGEQTNSFVCPVSMQLRATLTLSTEAGAPGGTQEVMLAEDA